MLKYLNSDAYLMQVKNRIVFMAIIVYNIKEYVRLIGHGKTEEVTHENLLSNRWCRIYRF